MVVLVTESLRYYAGICQDTHSFHLTLKLGNLASNSYWDEREGGGRDRYLLTDRESTAVSRQCAIDDVSSLVLPTEFLNFPPDSRKCPTPHFSGGMPVAFLTVSEGLPRFKAVLSAPVSFPES